MTMNTNTLVRVRLVCMVVLFLGFMQFAYGSNDPERLVYAYFTSGVTYNHKTETVDITSSEIEHILDEYEIDSDNLEPSFPDFDPADTLVAGPDNTTIKVMNKAKVFRIYVPEGYNIQDVIDDLLKSTLTLFAQEWGRVEPTLIPDDTNFIYQYALHTGSTGRIHAPDAWGLYTGDQDNYIAIIDWGVDANHPDLDGKVIGDQPDQEYHGTHVAGIAAAITDNDEGVAGVDWNAQILSKSIEVAWWQQPFSDEISSSKIVDAVNYSTDVNVLNCSWSQLQPWSTAPRWSDIVGDAITYAYKQNRVVVCASGNYQDDHANALYYPASYIPGEISVAATDANDDVEYYSNQNNRVDVAAPGHEIYSTYEDDDYAYLSGTSMATPYVSGLASLLKGYEPRLYNDDIEQIIRYSADDVEDAGYDNKTGMGRINARAALDLVRDQNGLLHPSANGETSHTELFHNIQVTWSGMLGLGDDNYWVDHYCPT